MSHRLIWGDCVEAMRALDKCSVDAICTDPPYELGFMGKEWDHSGVAYRAETWAEALRVLRPGGHLLAFGGTRTYHRLACAIEDAGFEIRDCIAWIYGSGFPKSLDVSKAIDKAAGAEREVTGTRPKRGALGGVAYAQDEWTLAQANQPLDLPITNPATPEAERWQGWGTALKPAHEPVVVARKPLAGTVAGNVLEHGTGALNVDGCRGTGGRWPANVVLGHHPDCGTDGAVPVGAAGEGQTLWSDSSSGTAPCVPDCPVRVLDEQTGELPAGTAVRRHVGYRASSNVSFTQSNEDMRDDMGYGDTGGASRFFYCAKASRAERNAGLDGFEAKDPGERINITRGRQMTDLRMERPQERRPAANIHPTVKPIELMRWLVRLVTPPGGTVLDPFTGSGTTGCAAVLEGFDFLGIEREPEYAEIAEARIGWWHEHRGDGQADEILQAGHERDRREGGGQLALDAT